MAMAAGLTILKELKNNPSIYTHINNITTFIVEGIRAQLAKRGLPYSINQVGSMFTLFFTKASVTDYNSARTADTALFGKYFNAMLERGVYMAPSQFEALFVSHSIDEKIARRILQASEESLDAVALHS